MKAPCHVWKTTDGRLVKDGDPDAAILAYATGDEMTVVPDWLDEPQPQPESIEPPGDEPEAPKKRARPADKSRTPSADK